MDRSPLSIQLCVADLDTTEAFYSGILDLPVQRPIVATGAPEHLVLNYHGCQIIFVEESAVAQLHPILEARLDNFPRGVGMTLHLTVTGLEEIYQELLEEDLEVLYPLSVKPYGARELWCFDPDGYLVVLEEPLRSGGPVPDELPPAPRNRNSKGTADFSISRSGCAFCLSLRLCGFA